MENGTLGTVCRGNDPVTFKDRNVVASSPAGCSSVKEAGVLIPFDGEADTKALTPESKLLVVDVLQPLSGQQA